MIHDFETEHGFLKSLKNSIVLSQIFNVEIVRMKSGIISLSRLLKVRFVSVFVEMYKMYKDNLSNLYPILLNNLKTQF